jgi:hypothetical protein
MKLPKFDRTKMDWDIWRAFYIIHVRSSFVQFDTGEFIVTARRWNPDERRTYKELNLQVVATSDDACPRLYVPGSMKPVPKLHLIDKGQQTLLLDLDHKRAVSLDGWLTKENAPLVPRRFTERQSGVSAWYAGPDAVPVGMPVTRYYPEPLTVAQRKHVTELEDAAKVWLQMQGEPETLMQKWRILKLPVRDFVDVSFSVLTTEHRAAIAVNGFNMIAKEEHAYLTFE